MQPQFGILGPLEAVVGGRRLDLGGPKRRRLLAALVLDAGRAVPVDRLVDALWDDTPPGNADVTLRAHVAGLRRTLAGAAADGVISTRSRSYCLQAAREQVDACRFEQLVDEGRAALDDGDAARAALTLREAHALWRGAVLDDLDRPRFAETEAARLEELRLVALEARIDADLALGRHHDVVAELEALVDTHPFREHLCRQLMLALYRSERQADALAVYRAVRHRLDEELGLAPGQALAELETAILRQDPALAVRPDRGSPQAAVVGTVPTVPSAASSTALFDVVRRVPMVGRADDLARLHAPWQAVRDGARRVVVLSGEAGVGKTRLVAELAHLIADDKATVVVGHCDPTALIPYQPVTEALRGSPEAADVLAEAPESLTNRLAVLLDRSGGSEQTWRAWPDDLDTQQVALLDAVASLLARMTAAAPVLFVVEDTEAIDWASARLLRHLARNLPERLLLLICLRDPPASRHPPLGELLADLERRGLADQLRLGPLSEHDLAALVTTRTGSPAPAAFVQALWSSTGGNPFYAGEVVDDLAARGSFARADEAWHVPTGVRDVLRDRLRTLTTAAREVIACAAILGREIDFALLAEVTDASGHDLVDALEDATSAGWLVEASRPGEAFYAFRHPLMREAVIADLPAPRRQQLHLRAADALEAAGLRQAADVAAAAVHLRAAGRLIDRTRAAEASLRAADEAASMYAWDEAIAHAEAAVAILANAGATPAQQAEAAVRTARLLERSGTDYPRAVHHLEAALEHYRDTGEDAAVAEVHSLLGYVLTAHHDVMDICRALECFAVAEQAISSGLPAFELHRGKAQAAMYGLRTEQGVAAATRALEVADQLGRDDLRALARSLLACHRFSCGELTVPLSVATDVWNIAQQLDDPHLMWEAAFGAAWVNNVYLLDPAAGESWCRRGLAQPRLITIRHARDGLNDHVAYALASQGAMASARELAAGLPADAVTHRLLAFLDGDWPAAERAWSRALADDLDNGDLIDAALNACWLGHVRWLLGRVTDALEALRRALTISVDGPHVATELMARAELTRILAPADEAAEHLARCDDLLAGEDDWRGQAGAVELARGTLASARGHQEEADAAYDRALAVFTAHELPWKRAETLRSWARCCALAHREDEAEERRSAAVQIYDELGAAPPWRRPLMSSG